MYLRFDGAVSIIWIESKIMTDTGKKMRKYTTPQFLLRIVSQDKYEKWLSRRASAHVKRDRKRGNQTATVAAYKVAMHRAISESEGRDAYTGELLDWRLISQYDNADSKKGGRKYKQRFALLPSVDHIGDGMSEADFKICSWRTNDAKNDLPYLEFVKLCRLVVDFKDNKAESPGKR